MKKEKIQSLVIIARRWFNRSRGSTYHSVVVIVNGKSIGKSDFTYGYSDAYMQTAHSILEKNGYFKDKPARQGYYLMYDWMRKNPAKSVTTVTDVSTKKDLKM